MTVATVAGVCCAKPAKPLGGMNGSRTGIPPPVPELGMKIAPPPLEVGTTVDGGVGVFGGRVVLMVMGHG